MDAYYRDSPPLLVFRDKDVISTKRPQKYIEQQREEIHRNSSIDPSMLRRGSRIRSLAGGQVSQNTGRVDELEGKTERGSVEGNGHSEYARTKEEV